MTVSFHVYGFAMWISYFIYRHRASSDHIQADSIISYLFCPGGIMFHISVCLSRSLLKHFKTKTCFFAVTFFGEEKSCTDLRHGCLHLLFSSPSPDLIAYNTLLSSLARAARWRHCLQLLQQMTKVVPWWAKGVCSGLVGMGGGWLVEC